MTTDIDRLEALVREEREQYRLSLVFPEMLSVLTEVRALRGIAEAARDFMALEHSYYGPVEFEDILRARLAAYDKEGSK